MTGSDGYFVVDSARSARTKSFFRLDDVVHRGQAEPGVRQHLVHLPRVNPKAAAAPG
jgi:hypothetical protein